MSSIVPGYIRSPRADLVWFLALPFAAIAVALGFHHALPYVAEAGVAVWITVPHHYATWVRSYGMAEDWSRWRGRLVVGPLLLLPTVVYGMAFAPVSAALVLLLWDHQHSVMQQHGFARVYDFKAGTGAPSTGRFDFWLGVILYGNMLVTAPLWSELWIAELYRWKLELHAATIAQIHTLSWTVLGAYALVYLGHVLWSVAHGHRLNPIKYLFLLASYSLWYFVSWQDSVLVYLVAHRLMHGIQYIAMVYWYVGRKVERTGQAPRLLHSFTLAHFLLLGGAYALAFHLAIGGGLGELSFGLISTLQADAVLQYTRAQATGFYAAAAVSAASACHYYIDSFIWKVSDTRTQEGL